MAMKPWKFCGAWTVSTGGDVLPSRAAAVMSWMYGTVTTVATRGHITT